MDLLDYENTYPIPERASSLPNKLLVGAGPTNFSPRVISAMTNSTMGACCTELFQMMDDIKTMLKYVFQTKNEITLALQTSGTGGIEAALCNIVDPGEKIIIAVGGFWGQRIVEAAKIRNADIVRLESAPNETFSLEEFHQAIITHKPVALFVTHGESSGGTLQNMEGLGIMCHKYNCLLVVDAVVTLGGVPFYADRWEVDIAVAGTQKAIGAPAGLALITMSQGAVNRMRQIKSPPPFYYNIESTCVMWGGFNQSKSYYITYNSHQLSSLREALLEVVEEGLVNRWKRHRKCAERFWKGVDQLGMKILVEKQDLRLVTVNCYAPPAEVVSSDLLNFILEKYLVSAGFGITKHSANALRIGFMGYNARPEVVDYVLMILEQGIVHCRNKGKKIL